MAELAAGFAFTGVELGDRRGVIVEQAQPQRGDRVPRQRPVAVGFDFADDAQRVEGVRLALTAPTGLLGGAC